MSDISTNDLNEKIRTLASADSRFKKSGDAADSYIWVADLVNEDGAWKAVIQASDQKYYEVSVVVDGEKVSLGTDAKEVVRKTEYEAAAAKAGHGPHTSAQSAIRGPQSAIDESLICRSAATIELPSVVTNEIMYMPAGLQQITPIEGGIGKPIRVMVDPQSATALDHQRSALSAKGKLPFFDFNHEDRAACFWPSQFFWKQTGDPRSTGVYARGEHTAAGKSAIEGKEFRQFSPVFHVDNKRGNPARIVCRENAKPNMGGLVNDAAFHNILPLWAKNAGAPSDQPNAGLSNQTNQKDHSLMTPEQIAALQAKNTELQSTVADLTALVAKDAEDKVSAARLDLAKAELRANNAEIKAAELGAKNADQDKAIKARNKADAEVVVKKAVERGAIKAKDTETQEALVARATEDPAFAKVIEAMQGNSALGGRITPSPNGNERPIVSAEAPANIIKGYFDVVKQNSELRLSSETAKEKGKLAREAAAIFAKDIEGNKALDGMAMEDAIKAADVTDTAVGLLAGSLVLQRALPLMQYEYPQLSAVTQDFSDTPGLYGQTENTRIVLKPAVQTYDTSLDSAGRPKGWSTVSPAQTVDVPVTLDEHVGVPIVFGVQTLAKTMRKLFDESAPQALYALGGYMVKKLFALFTSANFNAYAQITDASCVTTSGSAAITLASTAGVYPGQAISGTGIPAFTYIATVPSSSNATMTQKATASATVTATLGPGFDDGGTVIALPTLYTTYAEALADFNMASLGKVGAAMDLNQVPQQDRFVQLNANYYQRLAQDPAFNTFFAAMRNPEVITKGILPELQGFTPQKAPWFPTSSKRVGFAHHKSAAIIKARLPQDFTSALGAMVPGSVTTVTAPSGLSVLLVQYVNLQSNYAEWRPEVMLGAAVAERRAGLVLTSQ